MIRVESPIGVEQGNRADAARSASTVDQDEIVVRGRFLRIASIKDEEVRETEVLLRPESYVSKIRRENLGADVFTFSEPYPDAAPALPYPFELDNLAVIPITTFDDWWQNRMTQVTRKNVRRAGRRGVVTRIVALDEALAKQIKEIYDETPVRQGRPFWHYNKSLSEVFAANATYADQSEFICAYFENELIGFIRLVYVGPVATIMQVVSKNAHEDKRPTNALLAKAVERCVERKIRYLVYGRFVYGKNKNSPLTEFKRRNGFESATVRTYYVPLTTLGRVALRLKVHLGIKYFLPESLFYYLLNVRSWFYSRRLRAEAATAAH